MWTARKTDQMVTRAENKVNETLGLFLSMYYAERMPSIEEISAFTGLPPDVVQASLESVLEEVEEPEVGYAS